MNDTPFFTINEKWKNSSLFDLLNDPNRAEELREKLREQCIELGGDPDMTFEFPSKWREIIKNIPQY